MDDLKKSKDDLRSKAVYINPEELEKQRIREAKLEAADIVANYPAETNTFGKNPLGMIEKLRDRKLKGG